MLISIWILEFSRQGSSQEPAGLAEASQQILTQVL